MSFRRSICKTAHGNIEYKQTLTLIAMKKISIALLTTLLFSNTALAAFSDVTIASPNKTAIDYLEFYGVIGGYPDGTFRPGNEINRAELMKILVEGQGIRPDVNEYRECFPDVTDQWFAPYVCYARQQGWVDGYPDGNFRPANSVNNVEALKMILNARNFTIDTSYATQKFRNMDTSHWFYRYLITAEKHNLIDRVLAPGENYTRGDVSEVMFRAMAIDQAEVTVYDDEVRERVQVNNDTNIEYESARYEAYTENTRKSYEGSRPFAIFFHADWCPICREIESDLKKDLNTYPDGVLILEADFDTETALREEFGVTRQYYFVIFDAQGNITFSNNLFSAQEVVDEIEKTL